MQSIQDCKPPTLSWVFVTSLWLRLLFCSAGLCIFLLILLCRTLYFLTFLLPSSYFHITPLLERSFETLLSYLISCLLFLCVFLMPFWFYSSSVPRSPLMSDAPPSFLGNTSAPRLWPLVLPSPRRQTPSRSSQNCIMLPLDPHLGSLLSLNVNASQTHSGSFLSLM